MSLHYDIDTQITQLNCLPMQEKLYIYIYIYKEIVSQSLARLFHSLHGLILIIRWIELEPPGLRVGITFQTNESTTWVPRGQWRSQNFSSEGKIKKQD